MGAERRPAIIREAGSLLPRWTSLRRAVLASTTIAILAVLPAITGIAAAQTAERTGAYAVAGVGAIRWNASTDLPACVTEVIYGYNVHGACTADWQDRNSIGGRLGAGWRFNRWIAAEGVYAYLGDATVAREFSDWGVIPKPPPDPPAFTMPSYQWGSGRYRLQGAELTFVASIPLTEDLSVIGRAGGYAYWQSYNEATRGTHSSQTFWTASTSGVAPVFGAGVAWRAVPALEFRLEWIRYQGAGRLYGGWLGDASGIGRFNIDTAWLSAVVAILP